MKFKKIFQKAAAVVMAAVTVFSVLPATTAFAAVGDVGTISFSHTYDGNGNAMRYNSSANINGYIAGGTGNYKVGIMSRQQAISSSLTGREMVQSTTQGSWRKAKMVQFIPLRVTLGMNVSREIILSEAA